MKWILDDHVSIVLVMASQSYVLVVELVANLSTLKTFVENNSFALEIESKRIDVMEKPLSGLVCHSLGFVGRADE